METSKVDFLDENSPENISGQYYVPGLSQEITNIDNNNIKEVSKDSSKKEDQNIKEKSVIGNKSTINGKNTFRADQNMEKRQMADNFESSKEKTRSIQRPAEQSPCSSDSEISDTEGICLTRSKSCNELTTNASSEKEVMTESTNNETGKQDGHVQIMPKSKSEADIQTINQQDSSTPVNNLDDNEADQKIKSSDEQDISNDQPSSHETV